MPPNALDPRTAAELLADAERYQRWAERTQWNAEISGNFRRLAEEARQRAARAKG